MFESFFSTASLIASSISQVTSARMPFFMFYVVVEEEIAELKWAYLFLSPSFSDRSCLSKADRRALRETQKELYQIYVSMVKF